MPSTLQCSCCCCASESSSQSSSRLTTIGDSSSVVGWTQLGPEFIFIFAQYRWRCLWKRIPKNCLRHRDLHPHVFYDGVPWASTQAIKFISSVRVRLLSSVGLFSIGSYDILHGHGWCVADTQTGAYFPSSVPRYAIWECVSIWTAQHWSSAVIWGHPSLL